MSKAYVETTVLANALFKPGESSRRAANAIGRFTITQLPVYAIKELHGGILQYFVWFHNKCAQLRSYEAVLASVHSVIGRQPYRAAAALEAMKSCFEEAKGITNGGLVEKYGADASYDASVCDLMRANVGMLVLKAWARRRSTTTEIVDPLPCYLERGPVEVKGILELPSARCAVDECCMATNLKRRKEDLRKLLEVTAAQEPQKEELKRRGKVLRQLLEKPSEPLNEESCRRLGDAVFALFASIDATILTTNIKDIGPLASALNKTAETP